jgi:hypothetical protein
LSVADGKLLLGQWYRQKLHVLGDDGSVMRSYDAPHQVGGIAVVDGAAFVLGADEEANGAYYITRVDLTSGTSSDIAVVPFRARGLAWDGKQFWSNHREADRAFKRAATPRRPPDPTALSLRRLVLHQRAQCACNRPNRPLHPAKVSR